MREINKIAEGLFEKIRDRFEDVSLGDDKAKATNDPEQARFFNFDYIVDGENHGNITMSLIDERALKVYFSKNITDELSEHEKQHWYHFLKELREFAKRNLLSFEPRDITRSTLKHRDIQQQSKADSTFDKDEVIGESKLYGTSKSSYEKFGPARIIVRHSKPVVDEMTGARSRYINSVYVENHEGERFKMPFKSLTGARAMARHISAGGTPHDDLGKHICEMAVECTKLKPFMNNVRRRTFEDSETQQMVEAAFEYHGLLNNTLKRMSGKKGYSHCKEQFVATSTSYIPEDDVNLDEIKERFIKRVFNDKMTDALPLVHKAYKMKRENKFTEQFESWANNLAEGTWALPKTPDDQDKLIELLSQELPVGVDAQNATNALYSIFGDDILFDKLGELAAVDPEADARDAVMDRLQDLNPTMYQAILDELGDPDKPTEPGDSEGGDLDEGKEFGAYTYEKLAMALPDGLTDEKEVLRLGYEDLKATLGKKQADYLFKYDEDFPSDFVSAYFWLQKNPQNESVASDAADESAEPGQFSKTYGSGDGGMDGVVYEDKEECRYCGGECPRDEEHACDGYLGDIDDLYKDEVKEEKDKISYDPKTGKLTGWEHEGDWEKSKGKDPVGKIHHMSDVARKRTEKLVKEPVKEDEEDDGGYGAIQSAIIRRIIHGKHHDLLMKLGPQGVMDAAREIADFAAPVEEIGSSDVSGWVRMIERNAGIEQEHSDLHEAFEQALTEGRFNPGDKVKCPDGKIGTVTGDGDGYYFIKGDDGKTYSYRMQEVKPVDEAITMPDNPDYSKYDKPTFQRNNPKTDKQLPGWAGHDLDTPAYKRKDQYERERAHLKKLAGLK